MNPGEDNKNPEQSSYKPSRFILKKQQALIQQGNSRKNLKISIENSSKTEIFAGGGAFLIKK